MPMPRNAASFSSRTRRNGSSSSPVLLEGSCTRSSALIGRPLRHKLASRRKPGSTDPLPRRGRVGPGFRLVANYMRRVRTKRGLVAGDGGAGAVPAEIDDRLVEAPQGAVVTDADDSRVPIGLAQQPVQ